MQSVRPNTTELLPLHEYDLIIVSYSGGKDSTACVLYLLDQGITSDRIQLWHQSVDGAETDGKIGFMDWPCTEAYCQAFGDQIGSRVLYQWRQGGFEREMLRENQRTAPVSFESQDGTILTAGGIRGKESTRRLFPQVSADLSVRWCSAYLKIDVAAIAINNDPALRRGQYLFVTGERRQESAARSKYPSVEYHRTRNLRRGVDHWRPILDWTEDQVWKILERYSIVPHPAYYLGWGRVSCMKCIFGQPDQWASVRAIDREGFQRIADYEKEFGKTIKQGFSVIQQADSGRPYPSLDRNITGYALSRAYYDAKRWLSRPWMLPAGAFSHCGGPS